MKVRKTSFQGLDAVELKTKKLRLVAVSEFGPRIAFFGKPDGDNLLLWEPGEHRRKDWDLRGGHRVWVTRPGADESEDTYVPDNGPCEVELFENGFQLVGEKSKINETRRGIRVTALDEERIEVDNFVINESNLLYSGGMWALTCTVPTPGTRYAVPVGDGSSWDAFSMVYFREWADHGQGGFGDDQFEVTDNFLLVTPKGKENKRMVQSHKGMIVMSDPERNITFGKKADYTPAMQYPLGTNVAIYVGPDNFMVEMETMGPEATIKPGARWHHSETWVLKPEAIEFADVEAVENLFR